MREDWSHEILFALRAILFKLSIWDHNASYGAALQGLKYTDSRSKGPVYSSPTKWQKSVYGLLTVGGRYAWDKWESWLVGQEGGYDEVSCQHIALRWRCFTNRYYEAIAGHSNAVATH